jgi:hypothetical protein
MGNREDILALAGGFSEIARKAMQTGMEHERSRFVAALTHLDAMYRSAQADPKTVMPTKLSLAIESVLGLVTMGASPFTERRKHPRTELRHDDCAPDGRHIRPGQ